MTYNLDNLKFISENEGVSFPVFLYCNMKKNFMLHDMIDKPEVIYKGEFTTEDAFIMYHMGKFPLVSDLGEGTGSVLGELYYVDAPTLIYLDEYFNTLHRIDVKLVHKSQISLGVHGFMYVGSLRFNTKKIELDINNNLVWKGK